MPIDFSCPSCHKSFRVKDELAGKAGKCSQCGSAKISHTACKACGYYGGRQVLNVALS